MEDVLSLLHDLIERVTVHRDRFPSDSPAHLTCAASIEVLEHEQRRLYRLAA